MTTWVGGLASFSILNQSVNRGSINRQLHKKLIVGLNDQARISPDAPQRGFSGHQGNAAGTASADGGPSQIAETLVGKKFGAEPLMLAKPLTFAELVAAWSRSWRVLSICPQARDRDHRRR